MRRLINSDWVRETVADVAFSEYHGVDTSHLGAAILYYAFAYGLKARLCVCLGSGGGTVPMLFRQAQRDSGLEGSKTLLVDANRPESGWGSPRRQGGWLERTNPMTFRFSDILVWQITTAEAARVLDTEGATIDVLHIDADHTADGCFHDFAAFEPMLAEHGVCTMHDTRYSSVQKAIGYIRQTYPLFDIIDFPDLAQGVAIARRRRRADCTPLIGVARPDPEADVRRGERIRRQAGADSED